MDANERRQRASIEATQWWIRLQGEEVSRAAREQYVDWILESPVHLAEMLRTAQVHDVLAQYTRWDDISTAPGVNEDDNVVPLQVAKPKRPMAPAPSRRIWAVVASAALIAILTIGYQLGTGGHVMETGRGERREVALEDGSSIQVDPETRLRVRYSAEARDIRLEQGRAVFRVAKDAQRPFFVYAGATTVRAVGTVFGVDQRKRNVVVTVSEGKVTISSASAPLVPLQHLEPESEDSAAGQAAGRIYLTANQQVSVERSGAFEGLRTVDTHRELAWADGRLIFENDPLSAVIEQFNRYNHVQIRMEDPALASRPVSGVFDAADLESLITFIQSVAPVQVERSAGDAISISLHSLK